MKFTNPEISYMLTIDGVESSNIYMNIPILRRSLKNEAFRNQNPDFSEQEAQFKAAKKKTFEKRKNTLETALASDKVFTYNEFGQIDSDCSEEASFLYNLVSAFGDKEYSDLLTEANIRAALECELKILKTKKQLNNEDEETLTEYNFEEKIIEAILRKDALLKDGKFDFSDICENYTLCSGAIEISIKKAIISLFSEDAIKKALSDFLTSIDKILSDYDEYFIEFENSLKI